MIGTPKQLQRVVNAVISIHNMEQINHTAKCHRFLDKRLLKTEHTLNSKYERLMSAFSHAVLCNMSPDCKTTDN